MFSVTNFPAVHFSFQLVKIKATYIRKLCKNEFGKYVFFIRVGLYLSVLANILDGMCK
jgi:hypothetical protein